ncbi:GNAT family N-acetyltransferase [Actinoalloteichus spitiensis]|uniref:GNAT family N-acetyltransferase n=1 Tax=Actinoalloteichus spitiensis TaxID=252394 RepID=UPI000375C850|nr:GNAT family N-acetyltransferase [Actinoalloteichus spitiensis]
MTDRDLDDSFVSGPHLVNQVHPGLVDGLTDLWGRVGAAGGAVGFTPESPLDEVRAAAERVVEAVRGRREQLLTLGRSGVLVGAVVLRPDTGPLVAHRGRVLDLMVDPDLQRQGWGRVLLDAVVAQATAQGLRRLFLSARDGTGLDRFYRAAGWTECGRAPEAVLLPDGSYRDELWFTRRI